jgi:AraC-like DNA-binding protein
MALVDAAVRGALVALLLLVSAVLLRDRRALALTRVGIVFSVGLIVQIVSSLPAFEVAVPRLWQAPLVGISIGNAVLFWIFVLVLFDDEFALNPWHVAAWIAVFAIGTFNCASGWNQETITGRLAVGLQRAVPLVFAALAGVAAASTWRLDLIEKRRRLRAFIVVTGVAYTVAMLFVRLALPDGRVRGTAAVADASALLAMVGVIAFGMLRVATTELLPEDRRVDEPIAVLQPPDDEPRADSDEERLAESLQRAMHDDRVYRTEGMSLPGLASRLAVPEYRLRRLINRRLGFRNFNAYVNSFRLDEAKTALADPERRALPVLTIALDAGFQSIGPFNRAFKDATGLTPTEYRRQHLADS